MLRPHGSPPASCARLQSRTDGKATAATILHALSAQRGVSALPWRLIERAISGALNSGFVRVLLGGVEWPCHPHEAGARELALPEVDRPTEGTGGSAKPAATGVGEKPERPVIHTIREAVLDSSEMAELVEATGDILVQRFHGTTPMGTRPISARRLSVGPQRYERFHGTTPIGDHPNMAQRLKIGPRS
jgi:hypothetical protein